MAKRKSTPKRGRSIVAIVLLTFVMTAVIVVWRRGRGVEIEQVIADLDRQRRDLEAQLALLERDLREAASSGSVVPAAQRKLGLNIASDTQIITLSRVREGVNGTRPDSI